MKLLQNKQTGEIGCLECSLAKTTEKLTVVAYVNGHCGGKVWYYNSLAELNEDWEDYEEPTTYYYISDFGAIREGDVGKFVEDEILRKEIGNYFDTKEEAERTVEKLKALKRLKDKGFESYKSNICGDDFIVHFKLTNHVDYSQSMDDFDCVFDFGGEDENQE